MREENWLTVIIPFRNEYQYLPFLIASLERLQNTSFIFVDDESTDESVKLVEASGLPQMRLLRSSGGVSVARNLALTSVETPYVMFVDGDDWVDAENINAIQLTNADLINCSQNISRRHLLDVRSARNLIMKQYLHVGYRPKFAPGICGKIYRMGLLEEYGITFDTQLRHGEDRLFNLAVLAVARDIQMEPFSYYNYRMNPVSVCQSVRYDVVMNAYYFFKAGEKLLHNAQNNSVWCVFKQYSTVLYADILCMNTSKKDDFHRLANLLAEFDLPWQVTLMMGKRQKIRYLLFKLRAFGLMRLLVNQNGLKQTVTHFVI